MASFEIIPGLWMGRVSIIEAGHDAMVNLSFRPLIAVSSKPYLHIPFSDSVELPPGWLVEMGCQFIRMSLYAQLKVICCCANGYNRSGLIVASYLILAKDWKCQTVIDLIRAKCGEGTLLNQSFLDYLNRLGQL